jgi:NADH:ubiquinone oxidoreductase subunit
MLSKLKSWLGVSSTVQIGLFTMLHGEKVGTDYEGNIYYRRKPKKDSHANDRRWVVYNGEIEASRVPPEWHGWLHHQTDVFPDVREGHYRQKWQKPHQDNQTGTAFAYLPKGHPSRHESRQKSTGDYEPWTPPK